MTDITVTGANSFRMRDSDLSGVTDYLSKLLTPTEARYFDDASNYQSFTGTAITYDPDGNITGGTITGASTVEAGVERIAITGFSVDGGDLFGTILANDIDGLWDLMLSGPDVIRGGGGGDQLLGNAGADSLYGNGGNDLLKGETGNDSLFGGKGADILIGGMGADVLDGGVGLDTLNGGAGHDTFVFSTALGPGNIDRIQDFDVPDDTVSLSQAIFTAAGPVGTLTAARFYIGASAHDNSDRIIYDDATGALYYDSDGNGMNPAVQIALMAKGLALTHHDFTII